MTHPSLLPPNSTAVERAIEQVSARISLIGVPIRDMWNPETCPAAFLPWLAWSLSVDDWDEQWSEAVKRTVIRASIDVHRFKGTVASIKLALRAAGYGDAEIWEASDYPSLGRDIVLGTGWTLGIRGMSWADYEVKINRTIDRRSADRLVLRLKSVAPARCRLRRIRLAGGVRHVLGRGVWTLGNQVPLGGVYTYEVN